MVDSGLELWCNKKPHPPYMLPWFFKDWDSQLSFFGMGFTSHVNSILKTELGFQKSKPKLLLRHAEIEEELHKFFTIVENLWQINQCLSLQECYNLWEILKISQNMRVNMIYLKRNQFCTNIFYFFYFLGTLTVANSPSQFKPPINQPYANRLAFLATLPLNERLGYFKAQILKTGAKALTKGSNTLGRAYQNLNSVAANFYTPLSDQPRNSSKYMVYVWLQLYF